MATVWGVRRVVATHGRQKFFALCVGFWLAKRYHYDKSDVVVV
jgi:hypothetical protein